jgi:MoxR-like ATPase
MPMIMFGPPGTGKSSLAVTTAIAANLPYYKVACSPDALPNEVIGGANVDESGGWKYLYGPYLQGMRRR